MRLFNFWKKKIAVAEPTQHKTYALNKRVEGVELVSGEFRIHSRLSPKNSVSINFHLDLEGKKNLYEELTGSPFNEYTAYSTHTGEIVNEKDFETVKGGNYRELKATYEKIQKLYPSLLDREIVLELKNRDMTIVLK